MRHLLFAASLLAPLPALASPCTAPRLTGIWSLASLRSADPGVQQFYANAPNEVMRFGARGDFIYVAGTRPYTAASARQRMATRTAWCPTRRDELRCMVDPLIVSGSAG